MSRHAGPMMSDLRIACQQRVPTFTDLPDEPVRVAEAGRLSDVELADVLDRYDTHGFAVLQLPPGSGSRATTAGVAESLGLGPAFVPPLYLLGGRTAAEVAQISAAENTGGAEADHPSFGSCVGQSLHTDGTLQDIGYVKASVLLCSCPAAHGGDTMLFNATAAYARLLDEDPAAALALATPGTLVRTANINGCSESNAGPVFAVDDNDTLVTRYSMTETDSWAIPDGVTADLIVRGVAYLAALTHVGSGYYLEFRLGADQAIVFANSRIAHGRGAYRDSPRSRRCLYRSLHLRNPQLPRVEIGSGSPG